MIHPIISTRDALPGEHPESSAAAPSHLASVSLSGGSGLEEVILALDDQARRARELRGQARDAKRSQQRARIADQRGAARRALGATVVRSVAEVAVTAARASAGSSSAENSGDVAPTATPPTQDAVDAVDAGASRGGGAWGLGAKVAGDLGGGLLEYGARRDEQRAAMHEHATSLQADIARDAEAAADAADQSADRAMRHLDAIDQARRDAIAAILRG